MLPTPRRRTFPHATIRTVLAVGLVAALVAGCSSADKPSAPTPQASPTPTVSPAEEVIEPLLKLDEVDVAALQLPDVPDGADPAAWDFNAVSVRMLTEASTDPTLWDMTPGSSVIAKVASAATRIVEDSMTGFAGKKDPAASVFWASTFPADNQPTAARVVDARWTTIPLPQDGVPLVGAMLETTTVFTFNDDRHVVVQRSFSQASQRPVPMIGTYRWRVEARVGGNDSCQLYTDGIITPAESPDPEAVQALVDHVIDQTPLDTTINETDFAAERKKAC